MITLTTTIPVRTVLGSASNTNYDRLDVVSVNFDVINQGLSGTCQLVCSTVPSATPILGSYTIPTHGSATLQMSIPNISFFATLALTTGQQTTVQSWVSNAQNTVESGLLGVGVITGTQSAGT